MSLGRYTILILGVTSATLGLGWPLLLRRLDAPARWAVALGAAIACVNTTAAYGLVRWATARSTKAFLRAVLGGTLARMAFMLVALLAGIRLLGLPRLPFAVSLLAYFVLFLTLELAITQRQAGAPSGAAR